ncbi:hypothetical protein CsSME_00048643 [Camellia sinensis var. sinensis]
MVYPSSSLVHNASDESSPEKQKSAVVEKQQQQQQLALVSKCLLLSSSSSFYCPFNIHQTPLVISTKPPNSKPNFQVQVQVAAAAAAARFVRDLHNSIVSTADGCLRFLHSFASHSPPLLTKLFSLPSHVHNFSQVTISLSLSLSLSASYIHTNTLSLYSVYFPCLHFPDSQYIWKNSLLPTQNYHT